MEGSRFTGMIAAGCGFLLLVNTALILLILYLVITTWSPAGRQSLDSLLASLAQIAGLEQDTPRPVEATVAALATEMHELALRPDSSSSVRPGDAGPTPTITATATAWPTATARPTTTPRPTPTQGHTATRRPTSTQTPTSTVTPTSTPPPTATTAARPAIAAPEDSADEATAHYYVIAPYHANARSCPRTNCPVIISLALGTAVEVLQQVDGEAIFGSTTWLQLNHDDRVVYVHGSLLSADPPQGAGAPLARPDSQPQPQEPQPAAPAEPVAQPAADTRPAFAGMSCTAIREQYGDGNFGRDHPAYNRNRDRDNDGIACEL